MDLRGEEPRVVEVLDGDRSTEQAVLLVAKHAGRHVVRGVWKVVSVVRSEEVGKA